MTCGECGKQGRCVDPPTPEGTNTVEHIDCWHCSGKGCAECQGSGHLTLRACPMLLIDEPTQHAMRTARFAKLGYLPREGPWGKQREFDLHTIELVTSEQARLQNDLLSED